MRAGDRHGGSPGMFRGRYHGCWPASSLPCMSWYVAKWVVKDLDQQQQVVKKL
jgi:hypothetical protein